VFAPGVVKTVAAPRRSFSFLGWGFLLDWARDRVLVFLWGWVLSVVFLWVLVLVWVWGDRLRVVATLLPSVCLRDPGKRTRQLIREKYQTAVILTVWPYPGTRGATPPGRVLASSGSPKKLKT